MATRLEMLLISDSLHKTWRIPLRVGMSETDVPKRILDRTVTR